MSVFCSSADGEDGGRRGALGVGDGGGGGGGGHGRGRGRREEVEQEPAEGGGKKLREKSDV